MKRKVLIFVLLLCGLTLQAVPARRIPFTVTQPDGSRITLVVTGDERSHLTRTVDGCAVVKDDSGFYCYALRDASGKLRSSGCPVGGFASLQVIAESRNVSLQPAERRMNPKIVQTASRGNDNAYKVYVMLIEFQDLKFTHTREEFQALMNQTKYSVNGASGSVQEYFDAQCKGKFTFSFEVSPVVTLSKGYAYYGKDDEEGYDEKPQEAVREACNALDPEVDFSKYTDIFLFYAGGNTADGGADADHIWPHQSTDYTFRYDGKTFNSYAMSSELMNNSRGTMEFTSIGTFCHEFGHTLGLPDLYDVDYEKSGGRADALWHSTSLMDGGNYNNDGKTPPCFNAIELEILGLAETEYLTVGDYVLEPQSTVKRVIRMDSSNSGEYFLFECRAASGWDRYIGGSGLLVYHIDKSGNAAGYSENYKRNLTAAQRWSYNEVNANPEHQCADLIEARAQSATGDIDMLKLFFPYPFNSTSALSGRTEPALKLWNGDAADFSLSSIKKSGNNVNFSVTGPMAIDAADVYQDAVIVNWHVDNPSFFGKKSKITWSDGDEILGSAEVSPYDNFKYSYTIEGLDPRMTYTIVVSCEDEEEKISAFKEIRTSSYNGKPFIYLNDAKRSGGFFQRGTKLPLRVYNAKGAVSVQWYLGSKRIYPGNDGYYVVESSGDMRAVITYSDGSKETILKTISVR